MRRSEPPKGLLRWVNLKLGRPECKLDSDSESCVAALSCRNPCTSRESADRAMGLCPAHWGQSGHDSWQHCLRVIATPLSVHLAQCLWILTDRFRLTQCWLRKYARNVRLFLDNFNQHAFQNVLLSKYLRLPDLWKSPKMSDIVKWNKQSQCHRQWHHAQ